MSVVIDKPQTDEAIPTISEDDEVFLKAENYILEHGWCQRYYHDDHGAVCIAGALSLAGQRSMCLYYRCLDRLTSLIDDISLVGWNDAPGRTKEEVIDLLRQARKH